jgi:hypothetical protein
MLVFIALLIKNITNKLGLGKEVLVLSLLIFAVSPDAIYDGMLFHIRFHAMVFFFIALYLVFRNDYVLDMWKKDVKIAVLIILSYIVMVLSHSLIPFVFALFLLCMYISIIIGNRLIGRLMNFTVRSPSFLFTLFAFIGFFAWQLFYASSTTRMIVWFKDFFITTFLGTHTLGAQVGLERLYYMPELLKPKWAMFILYWRDIAIYVPAFAGFMIFALSFIKKRANSSTQLFLLYSIFSLGIMFIIMNIVNLQPLRTKDYAIPFIVFFAAFFYIRISSIYMRKQKAFLFKLISLGMVTIVVFTAFISPWSHTDFPIYLYDRSVRFEDVGVHNPQYVYVESFINKYTSKDKLFLSDDPELLYSILQPKDYGLIQILDDDLLFGKPQTYIIELLHLSSHAYYLTNASKLGEIESRLPFEYDRILDAQTYEVHIRE